MHLRKPSRAAGGLVDAVKKDEAAALRVTNLSDETTEGDLRALFGRFGRLTRVYLAKDATTHASRGFAFINFQDKKDAEAARMKLHGHPYDHLILHVEVRCNDSMFPLIVRSAVGKTTGLTHCGGFVA